MLVLMFIVLLAGFLLSVPVSVVLGLASLTGIAFSGVPPVVFAQQLFASMDKFPLVAVPLFILAGNIMEAGGISERYVRVARALVGQVRGGLAASCVITCMIFAAVSGSGVATTFAVGAILIPALVKSGYPRPFAVSLQASAAELGVIIPPSIPLILYAVSAEQSIGDMFLAGILPGFLIAGALIVVVLVWAHFRQDLLLTETERVPLLPALRDAAASLLAPVIILGGIYGGIFTPTEAAAVAVFYALAIGMFLHRELKPAALYEILRKSVRSSSSIMILIASAGVFSYLINRAGVPAFIAMWLSDNMGSAFMFLLGVNIALFVIGMFLESAAALIILTPILVPAAIHFGINPVHFGIVMVINLAIGLVTPPFGVNLFAACQVGRIGVDRVMKPLAMFVITVIACLMLVTYLPGISLALVR